MSPAARFLPAEMLKAACWLDQEDLEAADVDARGLLLERDVVFPFRDPSMELPAPCIIGRNTTYNGNYLAPWTVIGRYCTLAAHVTIGIDGAEPAGLAVGDVSPMMDNAPTAAADLITTIGCDVWIGVRSRVARGSRIGHGAIVAPHTSVAGDVPPYAVMEGNPARITRFRFSPATIERLLAKAWWRLPGERAAALVGLPAEAALALIEAETTPGQGLVPTERGLS